MPRPPPIHLTADVDCTGSEHSCVNLAKGGTLVMNGFTIKGGAVGVLCSGTCRVIGPGTILEAEIGISAYGNLKVREVDVDDAEYASGNLIAGVLLGDFLYEEPCPDAPRTVTLKNTTVTGNGTGDGCGTTRSCADLMTCHRPKLDDLSSCGTSYANESGFPGTNWDVCSAD